MPSPITTSPGPGGRPAETIGGKAPFWATNDTGLAVVEPDELRTSISPPFPSSTARVATASLSGSSTSARTAASRSVSPSWSPTSRSQSAPKRRPSVRSRVRERSTVATPTKPATRTAAPTTPAKPPMVRRRRSGCSAKRVPRASTGGNTATIRARAPRPSPADVAPLRSPDRSPRDDHGHTAEEQGETNDADQQDDRVQPHAEIRFGRTSEPTGEHRRQHEGEHDGAESTDGDGGDQCGGGAQRSIAASDPERGQALVVRPRSAHGAGEGLPGHHQAGDGRRGGEDAEDGDLYADGLVDPRLEVVLIGDPPRLEGGVDRGVQLVDDRVGPGGIDLDERIAGDHRDLVSPTADEPRAGHEVRLGHVGDLLDATDDADHRHGDGGPPGGLELHPQEGEHLIAPEGVDGQGPADLGPPQLERGLVDGDLVRCVEAGQTARDDAVRRGVPSGWPRTHR